MEPLPPSMPASSSRVRNALWSASALVVVIAGIKEAQSFLLPVTVAIMMAIICSPAVGWLERRKIPNGIAVVTVVLGLMGVIALMGGLIGASVSSFRENLPLYQTKIATMISDLFGWLQAKGIDIQTATVLEKISPGAAAGKAATFLTDGIKGLGGALSNTLMVVLTMILILLEGRSVPAKLRLLSSDPQSDISHFDRIATEVQSYLAIKTALSLATGVIIGVWAAVLKVDFALLWGLLAFLLNYIPNIGSIIAAVPAVILALIQHGPGTAAALLVGFIAVNMVIGNVIEPMWMGKKLGLSTTVVFLSLLVWGELWGPVGMLLSVPLTMVIKIMLENSDEYAFIATLLSATAKPASAEDPPAADPPDEDEPEPHPPPTDPSPEPAEQDDD